MTDDDARGRLETETFVPRHQRLVRHLRRDGRYFLLSATSSAAREEFLRLGLEERDGRIRWGATLTPTEAGLLRDALAEWLEERGGGGHDDRAATYQDGSRVA